MPKTIWECNCRPIDGPSQAMCGKPAFWLATHSNGVVTLFCETCRERAWERNGVIRWTQAEAEHV